MDRWRIGLLAGVVVVLVPLLAVVPPADMGPWVSAVVFGATLTLLAIALIRGPLGVRVVVPVLACGAGAVGGLVLYVVDRHPGNERLLAAIVAVVPSGFREDAEGRDECDGWGCSPYVSRRYSGPGPLTIDALVTRLRRACYTDAAAVPGYESEAVAGTCRSRNVEMSVSIVSQGTEVVLQFGANPRP
ncbi:MAG: hypothetical protein Q8K72_03430 [Acidimicrobiales bacterium]|nr:hypothetical protein [Acidimicrobiales bacterium]